MPAPVSLIAAVHPLSLAGWTMAKDRQLLCRRLHDEIASSVWQPRQEEQAGDSTPNVEKRRYRSKLV